MSRHSVGVSYNSNLYISNRPGESVYQIMYVIYCFKGIYWFSPSLSPGYCWRYWKVLKVLLKVFCDFKPSSPLATNTVEENILNYITTIQKNVLSWCQTLNYVLHRHLKLLTSCLTYYNFETIQVILNEIANELLYAHDIERPTSC